MRLRSRVSALAVGFGVSVILGVASAEACGPTLKVTYVEASPDRFTMTLAPDAGGALSQVAIDFAPSVGRAYVDNYYGPLQTNDPKAAVLAGVSGFNDSSTRGALTFRMFAPGQTFSLLVDLDDRTSTGNQNWLDGGEIAGTTVAATLLNPDGVRLPLTGSFNREGVALLGNRACS